MRWRPNLVLGAVVLVAVVVAIAAVALTAGRSEAQYEPGTPEAAVQAYLRGILERDPAALEWMSPDTGCDTTDLSQSYVPESARAVLVDAEVDGDQASVTVEISESSGGTPFDTYEYTHEEVYTLERDGSGAWLLTGAAWPLYTCGEMVP